MDFKPFLTMKNMLIGGGVLAGVGVSGFAVVYNNDIENKFESYTKVELANTELENNVEKLVLINGVGDVNIVKSDTDKVEIISYIVYNDDLKEEKLKLEEVKLEVENKTDETNNEALETYLLSATLPENQNYFTYLEDVDYVGNVKINYEIEVPETLEEIYVYNPMGDIKIYGANSSVKTISYKGNVFLKNITPRDFIAAQTYEGDINITVDNSKDTTYIGASVYYGNANLRLEDKAEYELGKDNPNVLGMENNIFEQKTYDKVIEEFLNHENYDKKELKVSMLSRKGNVTLE